MKIRIRREFSKSLISYQWCAKVTGLGKRFYVTGPEWRPVLISSLAIAKRASSR